MKLLTFVFLILLTLKLAGIGVMATASWWFVTLPLIVGAGFFVFKVILLLVLLVRAPFVKIR